MHVVHTKYHCGLNVEVSEDVILTGELTFITTVRSSKQEGNTLQYLENFLSWPIMFTSPINLSCYMVTKIKNLKNVL
jgi:hypothetical protein